ncbi:MAG TPA: hypothetical protein VFY14_20950 [Streptomyces sp.]|nr:hypothetical protein [Streptomyces sp.]
MARLVATVYVKDPETHESVELEAGTSPEPRLAALVTNPAAWEDGKPPTAVESKKTTDTPSDEGGGGGDRQATAKTTAAKRPARGRKAAEGSGGQ